MSTRPRRGGDRWAGQVLHPGRHDGGRDRRGLPAARHRRRARLRAPPVRPADGRRGHRVAPVSTGRPACRSRPRSPGSACPTTIIETGPDHAKTFTRAGPVSASERSAPGAGPQQEGSRAEARPTAWRTASARTRPPDATRARRDDGPRHECPSCPRSRPSGAAWSAGSPAARSPRSRCCTRARPPPPGRRRRLRGPAGRPDVDDARRRGKYLWLPLTIRRRASLAHLGMSGQLLRRAGGRRRRAAPAGPVRFTDGGPQLRFVDQRTFGGARRSRPGGAELPAEIAHIAPRPVRPALRPPRRSWPRCARGAPASSGRCSTRR